MTAFAQQGFALACHRVGHPRRDERASISDRSATCLVDSLRAHGPALTAAVVLDAHLASMGSETEGLPDEDRKHPGGQH